MTSANSVQIRKKVRKFANTLVKVLVVAVLFYFLAKSDAISVDATLQALSQWNRMFYALFTVMACAFMGAVRWQWLLKAQGIQLAGFRTFQLTMIGNFFNIALPGAVSGDFVKAFYVAKEVEGRPSQAFGSILFDRVVGLSALVIVAATAMTLGYASFGQSLPFAALRTFIEVSALIVFAFYAYLFLLHEDHDPLVKCLKWTSSRFSRAASIERIYLAIRYYHHHRRIVFQALGISILIHLGIGFALNQFVHALGEHDVSLLQLYSIFPTGMLVTAVPVAPAGVGTGHAAFSYLFNLLGSKRGADVFSLYALLQFTIGGIGGLVYLRFKSSEGAVQLQAPDLVQDSQAKR